MDIARWLVELLGNQQIHRHGFFLDGRAAAVGVVRPGFGFV